MKAVDPAQPIANVRTLQQDVDRALAMQRMLLILVGLFATIALLLACIGIYGAMAHAIGQRSRELGIRAALGASRARLMQLLLRTGLVPSLTGVAVGLLGALLLARLLDSVLFEVDGHDPLVFVAATLLLCLLAAVSIMLPARRGTAGDPATALRGD